MIEDSDARFKQAKDVTLIGSVIDLLLGATKIFFGLIDGSQGLVADGVHSLSDLATDFMVIFAMKQGGRDADEDHPYGHGRIETLATLVLGLVLMIVALGIAQEAIVSWISSDPPSIPGWYALIVACISLIAKEWVYHYTMRVADKLDSQLLKANAWHSRTDAISSLIVIVGIAGSMAGLHYLDALAAVGVALVVAWIGWDLCATSVRELIDTGIDPDSVLDMKHVIVQTEGVEDLHLLRTRRMGGGILVDVHIIVDPLVSVSEGHWIGEEVKTRVIEKFPEVRDITIHCDPEDDESGMTSNQLPKRLDVLKQLRQGWLGFPEADQVEKINLHYLAGSIQLEIILPLRLVTTQTSTPESTAESTEQLVDKFIALSRDAVAEIREVKVMFTS